MNDGTREIIGAALEVHRAIGPGLLESAYAACLCHEFVLRGIPFLREVPLPVIYKGVKVDCAYRPDFVIGGVVLEAKAVDEIHPIHVAQVMTYMRLGNWKTGLLVNFNVTSLSDGIRRVIL